MSARVVARGESLSGKAKHTMGLTAIQVSGQVDGFTVSFGEEISPDADEDYLNERLDLFGKLIGRQKARSELVEKIVALEANREMLERLPHDQEAALKKLQRDKEAYILGLQAKHAMSNKRTEWRPSGVDQTNIDKYDNARGPTIQQFEERKADLLRDRPMIELQIKRLRAIVNGADVIDEPLAEAAE